jgi:CBS domain-containing protein
MVAKELMRREVFTIREDATVEELVDLLVREHIHGCPVLDASGSLVGVVTQQDVFLGGATRGADAAGAPATVGDLMTSPAVVATEDTEIGSLCAMMLRLRIHRIPIVHEGKVTGIISSLDIIGEWARDRAEP